MANAITFGHNNAARDPVHARHAWWYIAAGLAVLLALAAGVWYFGIRDTSSPSSGSSNTTQGQNSAQNNSGTNQPPGSAGANGSNINDQTKSYTVRVYFSKHPDSDNDPGKTFAVTRLSPNLGVAKFAVTELLKGPTTAETGQGYFTTARLRDGTSNCAGADFKLAISSGTARLQFCRPFDHLGVVADGQADSELKATLKQFGSVQKVVILNYQGNCEFDLSGQNLCLK